MKLTQPAATVSDALFAPGPSPELGDASALYAGVIGRWDVEVIDYDLGESPVKAEGEWHFAWALEGRAVQDVFIVPKRGARASASRKGNRYGTTLRFYDPASDQWSIVWINPVTGAVNRLAARKEGDAVVQVGTDPDGTMRRWSFVDIAPDRFRWTGEASNDQGRSWQLEVEFLARRQDA